MDEDSPVGGDDTSEYEIYGTTPPRTKQRRNRERKQRNRDSGPTTQPKVTKPRKCIFNRRSTCNSIFDEILAKADSTDSSDQAKRKNKQAMKLLRGSERDLKLDITSAQIHTFTDIAPPTTPVPSVQIEGCKQFKSLCSRPIACKKKESGGRDTTKVSNNETECSQNRVEFHKTLSMLIRMGCGDKHHSDRMNPRRTISKEEYLWQNELKDIIWLELQAYHADRTPVEQDNFLCSARESVPTLLNDIMQYRFQRNNTRLSVNSSDSGMEEDCPGCLSMYCHSCMEAQNSALKDVEDLMKRLECAESLFPSSRAFAELYPVYSSPEFVGRVKAMCLWYNMTKHQRLKLVILGKLLTMLENKNFQWPLPVTDSNDSPDSVSPTDSNSSTSSLGDRANGSNNIDYLNVCPIAILVDKRKDGVTSPYRKYIENILKTKGLAKSLGFLDRLHQHVLRKAKMTLEKPNTDDFFSKISCDTQDEELQRFGVWSPEAQALNLPSYKSAFLFLSAVPLEVIHDFLLMRIEQKPIKPSPLSVRQLMRELKEGIKIATLQRKRFLEYAEAILKGTNESQELFKKNMDAFDESLYKVFGDYLEYLEQWALLQHDSFQKSLLEEEWNFCKEIVENIPGGCKLLAEKFCLILSTMLTSIGERLLERIEEQYASFKKCADCKDDSEFKQDLFAVCRELQAVLTEEREIGIKTMAFCKTFFKSNLPSSYECIRKALVSLKCAIPDAIDRVQTIYNYSNSDKLDEHEKASLTSRTREILMQGYRFGFEFYKEMSESVPEENREKLARSMVQFARLWMTFVTERCERGRGMRPRWAYQGLEFLLTVCDPQNTKFLSDAEFEDLKREMDACISHVIGTTAPTTPDSGFHSASPRPSLDFMRSISSRSRGSSPSPRATYKSQRSASRKTSMEQTLPVPDALDGAVIINGGRKDDRTEMVTKCKLQPAHRSERIKDAVEALDAEIDAELRKQHLIGHVVSVSGGIIGKNHIRRRHVTFTWQRGIKIGQGRFGKVYTAVNNNTGEMMAVKEIALQPNDTTTIRRVAEELKILEGIVHRNLVKYYGIEVHREEMLIFMEFCDEGTLESLIAGTENGLPELQVRRYTYQLLCGVACLHSHGIVHRDIKTANIFLTDEANCLKIGDFGCAAKIKSHTTMPGELKGFVGTQAYMAPEVFTKTMNEGHGRAADIWSVGCVVVEMASGKRPWHQFDSNYQIMFKVGMGESPDPPDDMIDEGLDFLTLCFKHDPTERASAAELLDHNFVKGGSSL